MSHPREQFLVERCTKLFIINIIGTGVWVSPLNGLGSTIPHFHISTGRFHHRFWLPETVPKDLIPSSLFATFLVSRSRHEYTTLAAENVAMLPDRRPSRLRRKEFPETSEWIFPLACSAILLCRVCFWPPE